MDNINYNKLTNAELKLILNEMSNEYESLKNKIKDSLIRMEVLDKKYTELNTILVNRTKGKYNG